MELIKTPIIPSKNIFFGTKKKIDKKAICVFAATGFFLDDDTYYKDLKAAKPASEYQLDSGIVLSSSAYFKWHYSPVERPLSQIVQEFAVLFETIIKEQVGDKKTILPLSGGLDSRTQAAALFHLGNEVNAYGYAFEGGHDETRYGKQIAKACGFPFQDWKVPNSYLWNSIEELASINECYSEFTHPRQMAFVEKYSQLGDIFSLGHWGDVLFDDMHVANDLPLEDQVKIVVKKVVKKGGLELATDLWKSFGFEGSFKDYLYQRIHALLLGINIPENANAQIRAFKSMYWAPRWTSVNLSVFESQRPISVPYYDNRMCEFICTVPEKHLAGRKIQIEYLKLRMPALAKITWQEHRPFNLYNYHLNTMPYNLPHRIYNKIRRKLDPKKYIQRNWELQFLGKKNDQALQKWLFENKRFSENISPEVVKGMYELFLNKDAVYYSHPVSMLLTISLFFKQGQ